uniref:DLEC1 cilia and flagella associated protein n=1 Tax=Sander lucioperca TaxID=283035 RepID=A0A8C9YRN9_SANLU
MLEEPDTREKSRIDPSVNSHRPASEKSQDISHVLASTFKDLYTKDIIGKDTLSNLMKTKNGRIKSAFSWCVDKDLLEMNNLISPQDYLTTQKPRVEAPAAILITSVYYKYVSQRPNQSKPRPKWKDEPSAKDRAEGWEKLQKLKDRHSFLRNPRFLPPNAQQSGTSLVWPRTKVGKTEHVRKEMDEQSSTDEPVFLAKPTVVVFSDYSVGHVYETSLELKNLTSASRTVRVIPPTTPYFSVGLGRFPGEGGVVAPGMSCKYTVRFAPDSLGDYEDFIVVETQAELLLVVPIVARRPPPILTLPRVLNCGCCLIGGVKCVEFLCQNIGLSAGTFCVIPKNQWPSVARTYFSEQPPFAVSPSLFVLQPGEATVVEVVFFPTTAEKSCQMFSVVCDNCQVKDISIEGLGQLIALELVSVSGKTEPPVVGEVHDLTAEHFVRFSPCNPHSGQQKKVIIRNNVHLELPFHWQIMKPNLHPLLPGETPEPSHIQFHLATDDVFHVSPITGVLAPCQEQEFLFTFCPKELKDYHSVCHLVLRDVPHVLQPVRTGSKVSDVIVMEIEVKGSTEPYQVLLEPYAVVIPGEIFICTTTRRQFKMWNQSKTCIFFQWETMSSSSHVIEVEPSNGRIEENECFDFDLILSGGKPDRVVTSLVCHIEHCHEPVTLAVEVSFKGPIVTLSVPSVEFGLLKLGEQTQATLLLTNITQLEASWTLMERHNSQQDHEDTQVWTFFRILVEPRRGVLPPLASCSVDVLFRPQFCQRYETELDLTVENGTGCHLSVRADVQSPQVCLLNSELLLSELYVGVPAKATITLFNQTLLPSHFSWMVCWRNLTYCKKNKCCIKIISPPDDESLSTLLLDFGDDVILKRAVTKQLLITNQTAIPAPFTIEAEYFTCHASNRLSTYSYFLYLLAEFVSSLLAHGKGAAFFVLPNTGMLGPFETQTVDVTAYTDMWGEYRDHLICKVGDLQPTVIPMQMKVTGCPLYFQMTGPRPDDQNQGPITQFGTHVSGGDTVSRSLRINNPTMFDIRMDWETYNIDQNDRKLVDVVVAYGHAFPVKDADGNEVLSGAIGISGGDIQTAWERNKTPGSEGTSDSLQSMTSNLLSVHIRPHVGNLSDYPYCITPQQIVIPAKSSGTIHVSFTPLTLSGSGHESRCVGLALGFISLDSGMAACVPGKVGRAQGLDLEPVRMDLLAVVKPALVVCEFDITRALKLKNNSEMPLHFRLGTQPPFLVLMPQPRARTSTSSNPPTGDSQSLVLQPQHIMQVKVAFRCSMSLLDHVDQADEEVYPGVTLIECARGGRKLRFQQYLLIHYSNNSLQTVPLCAHLDLATMRLSSDSINFGFCYVGQTHIIEVSLYNDGDSHVFRVTPDFGLLRSKELQVGLSI